ncbi:alpha-galactosidase [Lachnospiraceae bacterium KM106-2]|nr:alpha-galactosidase [Lachnospiraceae bacterium KM106-2]
MKTQKEYQFGDMLVRYVTDDSGKKMGLMLLPLGMNNESGAKVQEIDSLAQIKLVGDQYPSAYAQGITMRNSGTIDRFVFSKQYIEVRDKKTDVITEFSDERGYQLRHHLIYLKGTSYFRSYTELINNSLETVTLEMLSSFSLSGITPFIEGDAYEQMKLCRIRSSWSQEGRLEEIPFEDLQLEPSWAKCHAVRCERFGQAGSMPVNKFFPFAAIKDCANKVYWGAMIAHGGSWQMEVYRKDEGIAFSGGLADREFGHWMKQVLPSESFITPEAILSVAHMDSIDEFSSRLTEAEDENELEEPMIERDLPIIFNEYCTTWGNPSEKNIKEILSKIKGKGFTYFVIDCGWFKSPEYPWDTSMGDYEISKELFPNGLDQVVKEIRDCDMHPGIWFEIENVGKNAKVFQETDHLLQRDGTVLSTQDRRFFDMQDPWVKEYLSRKVIGLLKQYGFEYMKVDYNDTIGLGCDGYESLGEGLRKSVEGTYDFMKMVKEELPEIVLENCASGGHRLEPLFMSLFSMASFSDAHECKEIPVIAANLHRVIQPRKSQIWCVIRKDDSLKRIAYSIVNTFLGRMCISGDVTELSAEQWKVIDNGIAFYKQAEEIIRKGQSYLYGTKIKSIRHLSGWQGVVRVGTNQKILVVLHHFEKNQNQAIKVPLPEQVSGRILSAFSATGNDQVTIQKKELVWTPKEDYEAIAFIVK